MSTPTMDDAAKVLADPTAYADDARLHAALTHLRANNPVAWVDNAPYRPFWAITKHADIMAIERDNNLFLSEPRPLLVTAEADDLGKQQLEAGTGLRTLIHMDDPHHRKVRAIGADWFRPKAMRDLKVQRRRVGQALRRPDARHRPGMRLRHRDRGQLPALRDHVAARPARGGFPADAPAHSGDVRRRRRRVQPARQLAGRAAGDSARLLHLLLPADRIAPRTSDRRPGVGDRQRPHRRRAACPMSTPRRTT